MAAVTGSNSQQAYHCDGQVVGPQWVGSSSSQAGEAVVDRRLTRERQVRNTLLPESTDQTTGS